MVTRLHGGNDEPLTVFVGSLLALFIRANFSWICNTPRDGVFPDRVKIKITISFRVRGTLTPASCTSFVWRCSVHQCTMAVRFVDAKAPLRVIPADWSNGNSNEDESWA